MYYTVKKSIQNCIKKIFKFCLYISVLSTNCNTIMSIRPHVNLVPQEIHVNNGNVFTNHYTGISTNFKIVLYVVFYGLSNV